MTEWDSSNLVIRFPKIWEDYVDVAWGRQFFDGKKIQKYQLAATAKHYRVERFFSGNESSFRLLGLAPDMELKVQVRALVEGGDDAGGPAWNAWAYKSVTTLSGAETTVASVSSEYLHGKLTWGSDLIRTGPTPTHAPVPAAKFQLKVREKGTFLTSDFCEKEFPPESEEFLIRDLPSSAIFEVSARAISIFGDVGRWSTPVRYLTLNPVDLVMSNIGEDFGVVEWSRKEEEKFLPNESAIEEIVLIIELLPSQRELDVDSQAKRIQVDAQTFSNEVRKYRLKDLAPGRSYSIRSRYRNSLGDWTSWTHLRFSTLSPVRMPDAQIVGHNFIHVSWQRAEPEDGAEFESTTKDVKLWEVRCTVGKAQTSMQLPVKECETKLVNLLPGVDYSIDVRALTTGGEWGLWSEALVVTTLHRLKAHVEFSGETWLKVDWTRREKQYVDNITRYHVQVNCLNSPFRVAKYFPATVTCFTFEQLKPNTKFHVVIQAFSDQRWGPWSEPTEARTCAPCVPSLIRRGEDFVQLRWNCEYYNVAAVEGIDRKFQIKIHRPPLDSEFSESVVAPTAVFQDEIATNTYRVPRLPCYSRIVVQVRCFDHSLQQWCDWGPEKELRTLPSALIKTHVGETTVDVSWSRRPRIMSAITDEALESGEADPLAPEKVLKYIIRLNTIGDDGQHRELCKYHYDDTMPTTTAISELKPDSNYSLQLSYLDNDDVWSALSAPLRFRTSPLMQVTILDVTEGACTLHWGRWLGGTTLLPLEEKAFRVVVTKIHGNEAPRQYNVNDETRYTIRELIPSTVYKIQVSGALSSTSPWGYWSEPSYIFTTPAMEIELVQVGEDYAHVSWHRGSADIFSKLLPTAKLQVVASFVPDAPVVPQPIAAASEGSLVYTGDSTVVEYHAQLYKLTPPPADDPDAAPFRELFFESKLNATQDNVRVPSLSASSMYEASVCACTRSKQWGCWSDRLTFNTSTPTEVRVQEITQDHVLVVWGQNGAQDRDVWKYQLRIQGLDDEYMREVEFENNVHSYSLKGLSVNSCYACTLRRFLTADRDWGQWSEPVYIFLKVVEAEVVEVSQDWAHVSWVNKAPADRSIAKVQFLSLLGKTHATVVRLGADVQRHIFHELQPNTLFTVHLLSIEQSTSYQKVVRKETEVSGGGASNRVVAKKIDADNNVASFSIPVVNSEFAAYLNDGVMFRTHSPLILNVERVGQNFALLRWEADYGEDAGAHNGDDGSSNSNAQHSFEVECIDLLTEPEEKKYFKAVGMYSVVRGLKPGSNLRFAVRSVAEKSEAACQWSNPVVTKVLPMIEPMLGPGDGTDTPGVGEDYIIVHWANNIRTSNIVDKNSVGFDVRLTPLEGSDLTEIVGQPHEPRYHFKNLRNDNKYKIEVRTRITVELSPNSTEVMRGEWSAPVLCATLSPMAVAVSGIVEGGATVHWRRRNFAVPGTEWWSSADEAALKNEIATISSFHIRIATADSGTLVVDEQLSDHQEAFAKCRMPLKALSPATKYVATVRSSTGMLWGAWSEPVVFQTSCPCNVKVLMIGEKYAVVQWTREVKEANTAVTVDAVVKHWEVAFALIGSDAKTYFRTVLIRHDESQHCIGGLDSNTPYNVTVRPVYDSEATGQWSAPRYFVTMAPFKVDVGKVGETFVQVSWERARQETVQTRMRLKHLEVMRAMTAQIEELAGQLQRLKEQEKRREEGEEGEDDEAPIAAEALTSSTAEDGSANGAAAEGDGAESQSSAATHRTPIEDLMFRIDDLQQKMERRQKLSTLQIAELERSAMYPNGEDIRYELMVYGGALEGEDQPFLFRRRLGKGELHCRLESLQPKTIYEVTVRSLYTNGLSMADINATDVGDLVDETAGGEGTDRTPWGPWSDRTRFATLKPIVAKAKSVGSECIAVEWDTGGMGSSDDSGEGGSQRTAITKFQLHVVDVKKKEDAKQRPVMTLEDPSLKGYVVGGLAPNNLYTVTVRVCYEGDKWGVWSTPVTFVTMPKLLCKLQSVAERQLEFLIWRDHQVPPPEGNTNVVVWKPLVTEHQLAINGLPCTQTFTLEANTSTLLTLDTLNIDTEYVVSVKDRVEDYWQEFNVVLKCETVAYAPQRPTLLERKGYNVAIAWQHKQNLSGLSKQYVYAVEMAVRDEAAKKSMSNSALQRAGQNVSTDSAVAHGDFDVIGYTTAQEFRLPLPYPVHHCYFRVKVCKTSQTMDGEPQPIAVNAANPQGIVLDNPQVFVWSKPSQVAHFKTPSVPDHPTGLHVVNLTNISATLKWKKPQNHSEHAGLLYRVYLNNSYQEKFSCIAETAETQCELRDLIPNCHYRVAVTAESTMGTSVQNNTLHFSTRVAPTEEPTYPTVKKNKPMTSTLPPRTMLTAPKELLEAVRRKRNNALGDAEGGQGFVALLDDTASTVFTAARLTQRRVSPPQTAAGGAERPSSGSMNRPRTLPPLHKDANASA